MPYNFLYKQASTTEEEPIGERLGRIAGQTIGGTIAMLPALKADIDKKQSEYSNFNVFGGVSNNQYNSINKKFNQVASRLGFNAKNGGPTYTHKKRKSPLVFIANTQGDTVYNPNNEYIKNVIKNTGDPNLSVKSDIINLNVNHGKYGANKSAIAHELGHSLQNKRLFRMGTTGIRLAQYAPSVMAVNTLINPDNDTNKYIAAAGTLGGLANVAMEAHASYKGSKAFRSTAAKLSTFRGLPTYIGVAAAPAAAYLADRYAKRWFNKNRQPESPK